MLLVASVSMTLSFAPATATAAPTSTYAYQGIAFDSLVTSAGGVVTSGETARIGYGCGTAAGLDRTASSASLTVDRAPEHRNDCLHWRNHRSAHGVDDDLDG